MNHAYAMLRASGDYGYLRTALFALAALSVVGISVVRSQSALPPEVALASEPLYSRGLRAKPTLTLALSVEFPTVGAQYNASDDLTYSSGREYIGYFDAGSCYRYNNDPQPALRRFDRVGAAALAADGSASLHTCGGAGFSGNFMNWATASAIDILRFGLTGGDRVIDTAALTILQRAVLPDSFYNSANFASKRLSAAAASNAVPTVLLGGHAGDVYVANCLNRVHFGTEATGNCGGPGNNANLGVAVGGATNGPVTSYTGSLPSGFGTQCAPENGTCSFPSQNREVAYGAGTTWRFMSARDATPCTNAVFGDPISGTVKACFTRPTSWTPGGSTGLSADGFFYSRVAVCDGNGSGGTTDPRSSYCLRYPNGNYKPIGNLQKSSEYVRVAAFGYLNDSTGNPNQRYGGVLRVPMKYVGAKRFDDNFALMAGANPFQEWDPSTGRFLQNPDGATSPASGDNSNWPLQTVTGVVNYLNQFGRTGGTFGLYKTYDPVGELYYESLRYLQGLSPTPVAITDMTTPMMDGFPVQTTWTDPHPTVAGMSDYSCVVNNIVAIGDTNTHNDKTIPGNTRTDNDAARGFSVAANEPNFKEWTRVVGGFEANAGIAYLDGRGAAQTTTNPNTPPNTARLNMQDQGAGSQGASYYMAGIAYWAHTHDIRGTDWSDAAKRRPGMRVKTYVLDVNEFGSQSDANTRHNNQFFLASKYGGFDDVTGTGNPYKKLNAAGAVVNNNNEQWQKSTAPGEAQTYYLSSSAVDVLKALDDIFEDITKGARSIAGAAVSTQTLSSGDTGYVYQARFDPVNYWSGDVVPYSIVLTGTGDIVLGDDTSAPWRAAAQLDGRAPESRNIYVGKRVVGAAPAAMAFTVAGVDITVRNALRVPAGAASAPYDPVATGEARLNFLRGDRTNEGAGGLRLRGSKLGDIVNSGIAYSGAPPGLTSEAGYGAFATANAARTRAIFVGANDGMLHAFNASGDRVNGGQELFAYIPSWVVPNLSALTAPGYTHRSYVDATPAVAEAKVGADWKTVLVGGTGAGGQGVFALDITNPSAFTASSVLWEFTDRDDAAIGNVVGRPQILKFRTSAPGVAAVYRYFAVVASGVNNHVADGYASANGAAAIFLLDLSKPSTTAWSRGSNYYRIDFPAPSTLTASGIVNFTARTGYSNEVQQLYAGDLQGNLWKLDFKATGAASWNSANSVSYYKSGGAAKPMFIASDGVRTQPITVAPALAYAPNNALVVAFGTGKFLEVSDTTGSYTTQSVYALLDDAIATTPLDSAQAAIGGRGRLKMNSASTTGVVTGAEFLWGRPASDGDVSIRAGWYFDFPFSSTGERQISPFSVSVGKLASGTVIPPATSCEDGSGNNYLIDIFAGSGTFTRSEVGLAGESLFIQIANVKGASDTTGARVRTITTQRVSAGSGGLTKDAASMQSVVHQAGRLSWRQINLNR